MTQPLKIKESIVWRIVDGEALIMDINSGYFFSLNDTATEIWQGITQGVNRSEIQNQIVEKYDADITLVESHIDLLMQELVDLEVFEPQTGTPDQSEKETDG